MTRPPSPCRGRRHRRHRRWRRRRCCCRTQLHTRPNSWTQITIAFAAVGIIYVGALIAKLFTYTIAWVRPGRKLRKYGQWAVVTGATDGIGKGVCTRVPLPPPLGCVVCAPALRVLATR